MPLSLVKLGELLGLGGSVRVVSLFDKFKDAPSLINELIEFTFRQLLGFLGTFLGGYQQVFLRLLSRNLKSIW